MRMLTLNAAHARGTGRHQVFQTTAAHKRALEAIADLLRQHAPSVVALQEIDGPSFPTGNFDHLGFVARAAGFSQGVHGHHVARPGLRYGTALLATVVLEDAAIHRFGSSFPTPTKGFVVARTELDGREIDVVSVHLDFARTSVRRRQLQAMIGTLASRRRPTVIMGDFNMAPNAPAMAALTDASLTTYLPDAPLVTFPKLGRRLDAIFHSPQLKLTRHEVLPDPVSDHRALLAELAWR